MGLSSNVLETLIGYNLDIFKGSRKDNPNLVEVTVMVTRNGKTFPRKTRVLPEVANAINSGQISSPSEYNDWYKKQTQEIKQEKQDKQDEIQATEDPRKLIKEVSFRNGQRDVKQFSAQQKADLITYLNECGANLPADAKDSKIANTINSFKVAGKEWPEPIALTARKKAEAEARQKQLEENGRALVRKWIVDGTDEFNADNLAAINAIMKKDNIDIEHLCGVKDGGSFDDVNLTNELKVALHKNINVYLKAKSNAYREQGNTLLADEKLDTSNLTDDNKLALSVALVDKGFITQSELTYNDDKTPNFDAFIDKGLKKLEESKKKNDKLELTPKEKAQLPQALPTLNRFMYRDSSLSLYDANTGDRIKELRVALKSKGILLEEHLKDPNGIKKWDNLDYNKRFEVVRNINDYIGELKSSYAIKARTLIFADKQVKDLTPEEREAVVIGMRSDGVLPSWQGKGEPDGTISYADDTLQHYMTSAKNKIITRQAKNGKELVNSIKDSQLALTELDENNLNDVCKYLEVKGLPVTRFPEKDKDIPSIIGNILMPPKDLVNHLDDINMELILGSRKYDGLRMSENEVLEIKDSLENVGYYFSPADAWNMRNTVYNALSHYKGIKSHEETRKAREATLPDTLTDAHYKQVILDIANGKLDKFDVSEKELIGIHNALSTALAKYKNLNSVPLPTKDKAKFYSILETRCKNFEQDDIVQNNSAKIEGMLEKLGVKSTYTRALGGMSNDDKNLIAVYLNKDLNRLEGFYDDKALSKQLIQYSQKKLNEAKPKVNKLVNFKGQLSVADIQNLNFYELSALRDELKHENVNVTAASKPLKYIKAIADYQNNKKARLEELRKLLGKPPIELKDVTQTFKRDPKSNLDPTGSDTILQVLNSQGANTPMTVVNTIDEVKELSKKSGIILYRICNDHSISHKPPNNLTPLQMIEDSIYSANKPLNYSPKRAHGDGMYFAGTTKVDDDRAVNFARTSSCCYGDDKDSTHAHSCLQMVATLAPGSKWIEESVVERMFRALPYSEQDNFTNYSTYAAALGYDAMYCKNAGGAGGDYVTIFNKSRVIVASELLHKNGKMSKKHKVTKRGVDDGNS